MLLQGVIGEEVNGYAFANELYFLNEAGYKTVVKINSGGGNMLHAYSIFSAILDTKSETHNIGLAASAASYIFLAGKKRYAMDYSMLMIHNPIGSDNPDELENKAITAFKNSILTIYNKNTGNNTDLISDMMNKETWFDASQMINLGFADEIVSSGRKVKVDYKNLSVDKVCNIFNNLNSQKQMSKINAILGLKNEVSEDIAADEVAKVLQENKELKNKLQVKEDENKALDEKVKAHEATIEAEKKAKAEQFVNSLVETGVLKPEAKEATIKLATSDFDTVKNMFSGVAKPATKITDLINQNKGGEQVEKDFEWYSKNDSKELARIKNEQPEVFEKLVNDYKTKYAKK